MTKRNAVDFPDAEIVDRILHNGEKDLYAVIYKRYYKKLRDKCYSLLKDQSQAEEFTKDILSKAYEKLGSFQHRSSFSSWLYSVTYNHCVDFLREKKNLHYPEWNLQQETIEISDENDYEIPEIDYEHLMEVMELIHPEEKALLIMKYQDNIPVREIGKSLRISEDAAKMRIKRARTRVLYLYRKKFIKNEP